MVLWRLLPRLNVAKEKIHAAQQNQLDKFRFVSFLNLKLGNQEQHSALGKSFIIRCHVTSK